MIEPLQIERIWREGGSPTFTIVEPSQADNRCAYALSFAIWFQEILRLLGDKPTIPDLNHKILLNTEKRFEFKAIVPISHYEEEAHICVDDVFEEAFFVLKSKIIADPEYSTLYLPQPTPVEDSHRSRAQPVVQLAATPLSMGILSPEVAQQQQELEKLASQGKEE